MGQYDNIISSYLDKLADLRAQLESLKRVAGGHSGQSPASAAIQRIEYEILDLVGAIDRCRERSEKSVAIGARRNTNGQLHRKSSSSSIETQKRTKSHLIFRCSQANRVITTGIELDPNDFGRIHVIRTIKCRFCDQEHAWELIERVPDASALMSIKAEDYLGRSVQSEAYAAQAKEPDVRALYQRMAGQWYRLAIESEEKAAALK